MNTATRARLGTSAPRLPLTRITHSATHLDSAQSNTHVVLATLKRSQSELSSFQRKVFKVDDHMGIAIAGLTGDGRSLCKYMRNECLNHRRARSRGAYRAGQPRASCSCVAPRVVNFVRAGVGADVIRCRLPAVVLRADMCTRARCRWGGWCGSWRTRRRRARSARGSGPTAWGCWWRAWTRR
jgi:hypothetical protein